MFDGSEAIADHELLYRRIPAASGFFDPQVDPNPSPLAFRPTQQDTTGLSLSRAKYKSLEEDARANSIMWPYSALASCDGWAWMSFPGRLRTIPATVKSWS